VVDGLERVVGREDEAAFVDVGSKEDERGAKKIVSV
jgi:hypothetical protein